MKKLLVLLAFAFCPLTAHAQTPGGQPEFCVTSPSQTANYNQLCISASSSGGAIALTSFGSATGSLTIDANSMVLNPISNITALTVTGHAGGGTYLTRNEAVSITSGTGTYDIGGYFAVNRNAYAAVEIESLSASGGPHMMNFVTNFGSRGIPTYFSDAGAFYTRAFAIISGHFTNGTVNGGEDISITPPTNDPFMVGCWADVPLCLQLRANVAGDLLMDGLDASGNYRMAIGSDGTYSWGPTSNTTSPPTFDTSLARCAAGCLEVNGPSTGAPKASIISGNSAAAPLTKNDATNPVYAFGTVLQFTMGTYPSGVMMGDTVTDLTAPGIPAGTTVVSTNAGAFTVTISNSSNPYPGDTISFNSGAHTAVLNALNTPIIAYTALPTGVAVGQVVTDSSAPTGIPGGTTVLSITANVPVFGFYFITLSANVTSAFNVGGAHDTIVFSTSNTAGGNLTIRSGLGTGSGNGGTLLFAAAPAGSSGSAQNTPTTYLTIDPDPSSRANVQINAGGLLVTGDPGGVSSTVTISGTSSATISSGTGTVKMSSTNNANNTGWLKFYCGTAVCWVPAWVTNAP